MNGITDSLKGITQYCNLSGITQSTSYVVDKAISNVALPIIGALGAGAGVVANAGATLMRNMPQVALAAGVALGAVYLINKLMSHLLVKAEVSVKVEEVVKTEEPAKTEKLVIEQPVISDSESNSAIKSSEDHSSFEVNSARFQEFLKSNPIPTEQMESSLDPLTTLKENIEKAKDPALQVIRDGSRTLSDVLDNAISEGKGLVQSGTGKAIEFTAAALEVADSVKANFIANLENQDHQAILDEATRIQRDINQ